MEVDEKKCPQCAETIKAEAIRCRFCGSDLSGSSRPVSVASCQTCNVALVPIRVRKFVSVGGIIGVLFFIAGLFALPFSPSAAAFNILIGIAVSYIGGKKTVMACPTCGKRGVTLAT